MKLTIRRICLFIAAAVLCLASLACGIEDVARGVRVGATVAAQGFEEDVRSGEMSAADGKRLSAWAKEVGDAGSRLEQTTARWKSLSPEQKRVVVADFVAETTEAQTRLDAEGAPVFKSEKSRRFYAQVRKRVSQARTLLREFAPSETTPAATPASAQ